LAGLLWRSKTAGMTKAKGMGDVSFLGSGCSGKEKVCWVGDAGSRALFALRGEGGLLPFFF